MDQNRETPENVNEPNSPQESKPTAEELLILQNHPGLSLAELREMVDFYGF